MTITAEPVVTTLTPPVLDLTTVSVRVHSTPTEPITERVEYALARLGPNRGVIADSLRALQIKGVAADSIRCPLAVYLHQQFPGLAFQVGHYSVAYSVGIFEGDVRLTPEQQEFVKGIDVGYYRDLVD